MARPPIHIAKRAKMIQKRTMNTASNVNRLLLSLKYCLPIPHIPAVNRTVPPGRQNQNTSVSSGVEENNAKMASEMKFVA
jgi:hypothetical protein